jgi:hypothetical protein
MSIVKRVLRALRILTWKHWAWASGAAVLQSIASPLQSLDFNAYWAIQSMYLRAPWYLAFAWLFLLGLAWVESGTGRAVATTWRYLRTALAVGLLCAAAAWSLSDFVPVPPRTTSQGVVLKAPHNIGRETARQVRAVVLGLDAAFNGALAILIYARLRSARRAALALADAELARSEANRHLLDSRLDAAHAEVDPADVIDRLERIEQAYESDPAAADARLDELIAFLRGAIPRLRAEPLPEMQT